MSRSLTTLIDLTFDFDAINQRFSVYRVSLNRTEGKPDYAKQLALVEKVSKPKALIRHSRYHWVLLDQGCKPNNSCEDVSFELVKPEDCDNLLLGRLFIRALGKTAPKEFFSGLGETYLFLEQDKFYEHTVYKCLKFDLKESVRFNSLFIDMVGVPLSPIETVFKPQHYIDKEPKFDFDPASGILVRTPQGRLMINSPGNKNFTTNAIDISGQKAISLHKTKTGAIYKFVNLMNEHFSESLKVKLRPIEADWRQHYKKSDVDKIYRQIYQVIDEKGGLQVANAAMGQGGFEKLRVYNWPVQVEFVEKERVDDTRPALIVLNSPKEYEEAGKPDPKQSFYSSKKVTQSVYDSTILKLRPNKNGTELQPLVDTWIKEIAIKQECMLGRFAIQDCSYHYWFVEVETSKYRAPVYHILKCEGGEFKYEQQGEFYFEDLDIELPEKQRYFEDISYVIDMSGSRPEVCSIIHEQIAVIPDAEKLFEVLNHLEESEFRGLSREYIKRFLSELSDSQDPIVGKLLFMLEKSPLKQEFYREDLKLVEIGYRSKCEKRLIDNYFEETGVMLNYSLKGDHNEYLEALTGHFYDAEHSAYFVGSEKGGFKFSRGQFNHVRYLEGPEYLKRACLELTKSYFVRNKLATVRPFPFKHLAECREQNGKSNMA